MSKENTLSTINAYSLMFLYGNGALLIGHPAERLKVAVQLNLHQNNYTSIKPVLKGGVSTLYSGFLSCMLRQNAKYTYRTCLVSEMPRQVDQHVSNVWAGGLIKASLASTVDTFVSTPFENIKTIQMKSQEPLSIRKASNSIYQQRGMLGFFAGSNVSAVKSFPTWLYLFLGYEATESKRQKQDFLSTITWATLASIPVTALTTPLDLIKTQQQAALLPKKGSILTSMKTLAEQNGTMSLFKGFSFRLLHRSMSTAIGYTMLDMSHK